MPPEHAPSNRRARTTRHTVGFIVGAMTLGLVLSMVLGAAPAGAHGAMSGPASRAIECGPDGGAAAKSAACKAADTANGGGGSSAFAAWDNLRVPNVNGRDRQVIPDGKLCSGGLAAFKGLDLARSDWPTTTLTSGAAYTFHYRTTIPHAGSFRLYVTKDGYSPTRALRWADLAATPFLTVSNPPVQGGAYTFKGTLPRGRAGRQLIYTIWQTTSTPDTYYSCSDVVFTGGQPAGATNRTGKPKPNSPPASVAASPAPSGTAAAGQGGGQPGSSVTPVADGVRVADVERSSPAMPIAVIIGFVLVAAAVVLFFAYQRRDRARRTARVRANRAAGRPPDPYR